eukprot:gene7876-9695_t
MVCKEWFNYISKNIVNSPTVWTLITKEFIQRCDSPWFAGKFVQNIYIGTKIDVEEFASINQYTEILASGDESAIKDMVKTNPEFSQLEKYYRVLSRSLQVDFGDYLMNGSHLNVWFPNVKKILHREYFQFNGDFVQSLISYVKESKQLEVFHLSIEDPLAEDSLLEDFVKASRNLKEFKIDYYFNKTISTSTHSCNLLLPIQHFTKETEIYISYSGSDLFIERNLVDQLRHLNIKEFSYYRFNHENWNYQPEPYFVDFIDYHREIKTLLIDNDKDMDIHRLYRSVSRLSDLKELKISMGIPEGYQQDSTEFPLKLSSKLQYLTITSFPSTETSFLNDFFRENQTLSNLIILELKFVNFDIDQEEEEDSLNGSVYYSTDLIKSIREYLYRYIWLEKLVFIKSDKLFQSLVPISMSMRSLIIQSSNKSTFDLKKIGETIEMSPNLSSLKLKSFCYCNNSQHLIKTIESNSTISSFSLNIESSNNNLLIDRMLHRDLKYIKISGAKLYLQRLKQLLQSKTIETIKLPIYFQSNEPIKNLQDFCSSLQSNKSIKELGISGNRRFHLFREFANMFSNVFSFNHTITILSIRKIPILCEEFFKTLSSNSTLTELELKEGCISDDLVPFLTGAILNPNCRIRYLSLSNNGLTDAQSNFYIMLLKNHCIRGINLSENDFTVHQMDKMLQALQERDNIYKLDFSSSCKFSSIESTKTLVYFILESKSLLSINLYNCNLDLASLELEKDKLELICFEPKFKYKYYFSK